MATVKVAWRDAKEEGRGLNAFQYEKYLMKEREPESIVFSNGVSPGSAMEDFKSTQEAFSKYKDNNMAFEIIQSWSEKESKVYGPERYTEIGQKMAESYFPGHEFLVITHQDKPHIHNHILVNPVNAETGKRVANKLDHLKKLRNLNDSLCHEYGLSTIDEKRLGKGVRLSNSVRQIMRRGNGSFIVDLLQKADVARSISTSFDEFTTHMNALNVDVRVENKNITYKYPGREKPFRGRSFGPIYEKKGLIDAFKRNDEKFTRMPGIREYLRGEVEKVTDHKGNLLGTPGYLHAEPGVHQTLSSKDYKKYTKVDRRRDRYSSPAGRKLRSGIVPREVIEGAEKTSIFEYCRENKIKTKELKDGRRVIKGREYVEITGHQFKNTKNGRVGSIIDFVSSHKDVSYIEALSIISGNNRLKLLDEHGHVKRDSFKSFKIPKDQELRGRLATGKLSTFLKRAGFNPDWAADLIKLKRAEVTKGGKVFLFPEERKTGAVELSLDQKGKLQKKSHGVFQRGFMERHTKGKDLVIFKNPLDYFKATKDESFKRKLKDVNLFVMMDEKDRLGLDMFLVKNPQIKDLLFHDLEEAKKRDLKKQYDSFGLRVRGFDPGEKHRSKDRGLEI